MIGEVANDSQEHLVNDNKALNGAEETPRTY